MNIEEISHDVLDRLAQRHVDGDSSARIAAIDAAMTPQWKAEMDRRLRATLAEASAPRSKLRKVYALLDEVNALRTTHMACKRGCTACCHMQVEISDVEAQRIATATGRKAARLPAGHLTTPMEKLGRRDTPCPFLKDDECSIYEDRPFVCREMAVLDRDALVCSFENMALARAHDARMLTVPQATVPPLASAYSRIVTHPGMTLADIRQFFPPTA